MERIAIVCVHHRVVVAYCLRVEVGQFSQYMYSQIVTHACVPHIVHTYIVHVMYNLWTFGTVKLHVHNKHGKNDTDTS